VDQCLGGGGWDRDPLLDDIDVDEPIFERGGPPETKNSDSFITERPYLGASSGVRYRQEGLRIRLQITEQPGKQESGLRQRIAELHRCNWQFRGLLPYFTSIRRSGRRWCGRRRAGRGDKPLENIVEFALRDGLAVRVNPVEF